MTKKAKDTEKQRDLIITMVISLILGAGGGFAVGALTDSGGSEVQKTTETADAEMAHSHSSEMFVVSAEGAPTVNVTVTEDAISGYNVKIATEKFAFTPDNVNDDNVIGEGHAHLYVDGVKISRLYGSDYHYNESFEGTKTFRVTLNANDHSEYAVDGEVIAAEVKATHESRDQSHTDDEMMHMDGDDHSNM